MPFYRRAVELVLDIEGADEPVRLRFAKQKLSV